MTSETRLLWRQIRSGLTHRRVRTFTPAPEVRMHPRARERALERIDGLATDRRGETVCTSCGEPADRSHRCDFLKGWNV